MSPKPAEKSLAADVPKPLAVTPAQPSVGLEAVEPDDLMLPQLLLMQGQSKLVQDRAGKPKLFGKIGEFVNSLTEEVVVDPIFIPCVYSRYFIVSHFEGTGDNQTKVFEFRTDDKEDKRLEGRSFFRDGDKRAEVQTVRAFIGLIAGQPIVVSFKSPSDLDGGKKLLTFVKLAGGPIYGGKYKLIAKQKTFTIGNKTSSIFVKDASPAGDVTPEEYAMACQIRNSFAGKADVAAKSEEAATEVPF